jgi:putative transposase
VWRERTKNGGLINKFSSLPLPLGNGQIDLKYFWALARSHTMSFVRIWVHLVFTTRDREAYFTHEIRQQLIAHIIANAKSKDIYLEAIGGWSEHLHLLVSLGGEQTIAKVAMLLKGESSHWLNRQNFFRGKFLWQDDYFAISVSESLVGKVKAYIQDQEEHHKAVPFSVEYERFKEITDNGLG